MTEEIKEPQVTEPQEPKEPTTDPKPQEPQEPPKEPKADDKPAEPKADDKPTEPQDPKPQEPAKPVEYNFKFPDGIKVEDTEVAKLKELSKELKLSNEQAQKFVDFTVSQVKFFGEKAEQNFKTMREGWAKQTKETYTEEQIGNAGKVAKEIGGKDFMELLETTGLADNPLMVGFLEKMSVNYRNDKTVVGKPNGGEPTKEQALDMLYPNTK